MRVQDKQIESFYRSNCFSKQNEKKNENETCYFCGMTLFIIFTQTKLYLIFICINIILNEHVSLLKSMTFVQLQKSILSVSTKEREAVG